MSDLVTKFMRSGSPSWLKDRIRTIRTSPDGASLWLRDLGKNGLAHAEAVVEYAGKILSESRAKLSAYELYLLLHSIYVHDIGYRTDPKTHAKISRDMLLNTPSQYFIHDPRLAEAIAYICAAHGMSDISMVPCEFPIGVLSKTDKYDLRFLAALLILADEMDQGYLRVFNTLGQESSPRHEVYHVDVGPQIVKLKTTPTNKEQYDHLTTVATNIEKRLAGMQDILSARQVNIERVVLYPTQWSPHTSLADTYEENMSLLFLLDRTVFGMQMLQEYRSKANKRAVISHLSHLEHPKFTASKARTVEEHETIVWVLGEDFGNGVPRYLLEEISRHTQEGGGLVMFPFVAWSVAQGLNDLVEELVPVRLDNTWREAAIHSVDQFADHPIAQGIAPFTIMNTFEILHIRDGFTPVVSDREGNPVVTVGSYGNGRVAYVNISSHDCKPHRKMQSPWDASEQVRKLVQQTIKWSMRRKTSA